MMVTFVSQCEKKALNKTRRVLDSFADRIGDRTWQTIITEEGLQAVKKLLRQSATKNTAVACHWMRSRIRSELIWIIGNRNKFNEQGIVPVNSTRQNIINTQRENDWHLLPLIKSLVAVAALFHDWGKASEWFQSKLTTKSNQVIGDPLRHEWISVLFLNAFVNGESDELWLARLANGEFDKEILIKRVVENTAAPLHQLPPAALSVAWLILTHHRMPQVKKYYGTELDDFGTLFKVLKANWQYQNKFDDDEYRQNEPRCFDYPRGLPSDSNLWLKPAKKWASKLSAQIEHLHSIIKTDTWRWVMQQARMSLMLGDHAYSSQVSDSKFQPQLKLYANTKKEGKKRKLDQSLEEHLLGVMKAALHRVHHFPMFEALSNELGYVQDNRVLKKKSPAAFRWQDKAVEKLTQWRTEQSRFKSFEVAQYGFFAVNMASTGKGKTFANAKIMRALSYDQKSLRYILALGLRTLTLQTGDEYRQRIGLQDDELAVLIGSRAVQVLHQQAQNQTSEAETFSGSESGESLFDDEIIYDSPIPDGILQTVLTNAKQQAMLYAPVLVCTIDHIMGATETARGGRYILPSLRLMSSDLVIDEIDDFTGKDLIAIGRLVHLAGMSGRKVMISSATIPPDLAKGLFNAYQAGWQVFAQARQKSQKVGCAWIDEFASQVETLPDSNESLATYGELHQKFTQKRLAKLNQQPAKRKVNLVKCSLEQFHEQVKTSGLSAETFYFQQIQNEILRKHQQHSQVEEKSQKRISFGVVRVANINPCISLSRYLLQSDIEDTEIRVMAYHSRQLLLMRNAQEKHLDELLKRDPDHPQTIFKNSIIQNHIQNSTAKNVIFVLVATPVEEVGRDHDLDWAVIEPSSIRSIVQMAGRVLRHRSIENLEHPNIGILQYNLKGFQQALKNPDNPWPVFNHPGYENAEHLLHSHDLTELIDFKQLEQNLDASLRITKNENLQPKNNLADLEHVVTEQCLLEKKAGPESLKGWLQGYWWLTAIPQSYVRFREGVQQVELYLMPDSNKEWVFKQRNDASELVEIEKRYGIRHEQQLSDKENNSLWLYRDYQQLLKDSPEHYMPLAAAIFGEISLDEYLLDSELIYNPQLGLEKK
ncbi:type I-F CRISPR-associated helicase Cas3f [Thiomicrorhabdus xiamenensis]|uniref:Type I-F CRISPR-associated helicase Cas3 n=1 Tax=Thiomicrorhabdus xiamenensis TaxID=2739063 RepID=A0A7D4TEP0_9GAMM|nr:type I-F CRISPR-associated helicase Cas3f [Thiomicrorhabdus xiamenensis]QKI88148.1 type I-F CRISPR-associated helicase Cas3 [Thiomicrorhabdus xiamenensis]